MSIPTFLHVDLDAFYASVEQLDNSNYRGKPVIVGSLPTDKRGVVSTCSYEARKFGIHSAMPIAQAYRLCPKGIFLRGNMSRYQEKSREVMNIFKNYSPDVQQISIDEAFIDITGTEKLFGPPETTAKQLQHEVVEKTGLSVSIGIATTKYIAKIASDINKPNGIYFVKKGNEINFMLSLPLKKVWGLGAKTQEKLEKAGISTTKDIYNASQPLLASIVGENTAIFLTNAVRGQLPQQFNTKPKSHSISSERTFPVDVNDTYAIETALMDLSYEIMFRMIESGWKSKTATIKIRYENFATISAQVTTNRYIFSAEDLYTRIISLFHKKYEKGRGIRLIGCGTQNLEKDTEPEQAELFDFDNKKNRAVETAILQMQKKNPNLKIKKARLLTNNPIRKHRNLFILAFLLPFFLLPHVSATDFPEAIEAEDPEALYQYSPDNENVEFYAEGSWDTKISSSSEISKDSDGTVTFDVDPLILTTTVDLTAWFMLFDTWYFEANVADDFDDNTVAAGYYGEGALKHARIGNRNIEFPETYGISDVGYGCGSSTLETPGFMTEWSGSDWSANTIIRYDQIETEEKSWTGLNEISDDSIAINEYTSTLRFELPSSTLFDYISDILVETDDEDDADYIDENGVYYEILDSDDYLEISSSASIVLSSEYTDNILIRFTSDDGEDETETYLGSWDDADDFLGNIQNAFDTGATVSGYSVDLKEACGKTDDDTYYSYLFINTISSNYSASEASSSGISSLYLHHSGCFSPFADYSIYTTDSGSSATSISVQYESTGLASSDFAALSLDDSSLFGGTFTDKDFFDDSYSVIQLYTIEDDDDIERFPLAKTNPSVYFSTKIQTDLEISVETTTSVDELIIGSDATGSSIKVYRNGIKENSFIYNQDEGTVTLSPPPSSFDSIYITWSEYSESSDTALFTVAAGYEKQVSKYFSYNISTSLFYPINDDSDFATLESTTPFSTSLALNTSITTPSITLENTICGTLQQTNLSGKLRVFGMSDDEPVTLYFDSDPTIDDSSQNMSASTSRSDSDSTYQLELEWTLDSTDDSAYQAFEFYSSSDCLATTDEFTITIDGLSEANNQDCTVYLQLGVDDDGDATSLTPEWELSSDNEDDDYDDDDYDYSEDTGSITVTLTDSDRSLIGDNTAVRIVVEKTDKTDSSSYSGTLTISDCYATQCAFGVNSPDYYTTTLSSEDESPSNIDEPSAMTLFTDDDDTNYVQKLTWKSSLSSGETISAFTATGYTDSIPLAEYGELHFFAYFDPDDSDDDYAITINLTRPETDESETAFCLTLLPDAVSQLTTSWHEVALNMVSKELTIDDDTIDSSYYTVSVDTDISPTCLTVEILPSDSDGSAFEATSETSKNGKFYIDELYLSETEFEKKLIDYFDFTWTQQNAVNLPNGFVCITDSSVKVNAEGVLSSPDQYSDEASTLLQTTTQAQTSIPFFTIASLTNSEATTDSSEDKFRLTGLGYTIKTNKLNFETSALAKILSASDSTTVSANNSYFTGTRSSQASLDFTDVLFPVSLTATSSVESDEESAIQAAEAILLFQPSNKWTPSLHFEGTAYQKLDSNICTDQSDADTLTITEFDSSWINLSEFQYSIGDDSASKKKLQLSASSTLDLPWYSISPDLTCTASSTDTDDENSSSNKIELSFPATINQQHFSTSFESKYVTVTSSDTEGTYATNVYSWQTAIQSQSEYWLNNPFSNFFGQTLSQDLIDICSENSDIETVTTTGSASFSWKRPIFASFYDFIVPSSASLSFERDTQASDSDYTDTYQTEITVAGTAFDCFGSKGSHPLFYWYEQDEFINSITTTFRYGSSERITVETYSSASFSINSKDYFSYTLNTSIDTDDSTSVQVQGSYTWYKDTCIISDIFLHFMPRFSNLSHTAKRNEYILYEYDNDSDDITHSLTASHKLTSSLTDVFSAYTKFEDELTIEDDSFSLSNTVSIGVQMDF